MMNKSSFFAAILVWANLFSAVAQQTSLPEKRTATGIPVTVEINPNKKYQKIISIGGNFAQANYTKDARDAVGAFALKNLQATHVRVPIPLKKWEPENDNTSATDFNWVKFEDAGVTHSLFQMLQEMKAEHGVTNITASVWDAPDWMISNPAAREGRFIKPEAYPEVIESIAAFLVKARDTYSISVDYFSFNESDGGYQLKLSVEETIKFIQMAGPRFKELGLQTKFLTGDVHKTDAVIPYVTPILAEESIREYLGPISYHSWWSENLPDQEFVAIRELGDKYDLPVWCTEVGYDAMLWRTPEAHPTWKNAWNLAKIQHRILKYSGASVTHYWTFQNNFPIASKEGEPYPIFYAMKQLSDNLPAGSQIVEANSDNAAVWALAATGPGEHFMVQLLNTTNEPQTVSLKGLPKHQYNIIRTDAQSNMKRVGQGKPRRRQLTLTLPPQSINTLTTGNKMLNN